MPVRPTFFLCSLLVLAFSLPAFCLDHADGDTDVKSKQLDITDFYVFTERSQNLAAQYHQLIFVMNVGPQLLPKTQYYFSENARYEFQITRVQTSRKSERPVGTYDAVLRLEFGAPDENKQQAITFTAVRSGKATFAKSFKPDLTKILTTPHSSSAVTNLIEVDDAEIAIFAGLREDPSFFDLKNFLKVRQALVSSGGTSLGSGFLAAAQAEDFSGGRNVNSIVLRVPRTFLQRSSLDTVFDVWASVSASDNAL